MLTALDAELFPDDCEVVEISSRNLWIYLIQKNGTSSLRIDADRKGWTILKNQHLSTLSYVDIFLRDPRERYLSGLNTFVQHFLRDNPALDKDTCTHMASRYLFLNRHYLPQWHWIANLSRFLNPECQIRFHDFQNIGSITQINTHADIIPFDDKWAHRVLQTPNNLELWLMLDEILLGYIGQSLTWKNLLSNYHAHPSKPLDIIFNQFNFLSDVLRPS